MVGRNEEKARLALAAMKKLGFGRKEATPVLKRLFRLFDRQWEPIEEDSYRALAEAILDDHLQPQSQSHHQPNGGGGGGGGNEAPGQEEEEELDAMPEISTPDRPSTTTTPQSSSSRTHFRAPASASASASAPPSGSTARARGIVERVVLAPAPGAPSPTALLTKHKQMMMDAEFQQPAFFPKHPNPQPPQPQPQPQPVDMDASACRDVQPGLILRSRNRNLNASSSSKFNPLPPPDRDRNPHHISGSDKNRAIQHHNRNLSAMPAVSVEPTSSSTLINGTGSQVQEIHVASSPGGEVKLSLKCSAESSKLKMPDLEAVYKMVEDKYLCSDKLLPPDFSIPGLMAEICQCVVQLGTQHTVEHITQSRTVGNGSTSKCVEGGSASSTTAPQPHLALSRTTHDVHDISKGQENVKIPVANESGRGKCPPSFSYVPGNEVFQNGIVNISLAQIGAEDCCAECFGDCLSAPVPCACARVTGGEYAYTPGGLVKPDFIDKCVSMNRVPEAHHKVFCKTCPLERSRDKASPEPCRGHLVRRFIKECWSKCGCSTRCGNRVVQRGIRFNLQVFSMGNGRGWGLRTQNALPKGAFVCEYAGEILTCAEVQERVVENMKNARYTHTVVLDAGWSSGGSLKDEEALCLDGTFYGNVGRFINHRCRDSNLAMVPVQVETPDRHYYHVAFFTSRKVEALEELTWDYGIDFDEELGPVKVFECLCGSKYCRGSRRHRQRLRNGNGKKRSRGGPGQD
ncbi:probable inactive histone-lysine N-methyltransferase SUVR2 isoform X2 [Triticum dicoccoides]|uniref:probable inactive histone-lysine N-methyltransferase SUVR2 isoform X2 n=1 Tax=Triticum dicoccoides TaxID=85692 RepID=UPI00188E3FE7|nr:probable inactive histone-lysine N-methyltransferase SUVR2 isoform X2 [Triticum dicoccoides]